MKKALFVALWVSIGLTAVAQITLSFNPEKGEKYNYQMEMIQKINQTIMGQAMDMDQTMVMDYDMSILDKTAAGIKVEFEYKSIYFNLASAMMSMKYDSKNPPASTEGMDGMMAKILGTMINKKFQMVVEKDGTVSSVTGMQAIIDDMTKAVGGNDMMGMQVAESMKQQFSDDAMKQMMEQTFKIYPKGSIKTGDSWSAAVNTGAAGMNMNVNTTYKLKSVDSSKAIADVTSTIDGFNGQLTGTQSGVVEFDVKSGLPVSSKIEQKAKGTISAQGMEVPMDITSNVNVKVVKVK